MDLILIHGTHLINLLNEKQPGVWLNYEPKKKSTEIAGHGDINTKQVHTRRHVEFL